MSEYPIGLNGEMIHCLADDEYSQFCRSKLEREVKEYGNKTAQEQGKWKKKHLIKE